MKEIFGTGALLLCFYLAMADKVDYNITGGWSPVDSDEVKHNPDIQEGLEKIREIIRNKEEGGPRYYISVTLPDLAVFRQEVAGVNYKYTWTKEEFISRTQLSTEIREWTVDVNCRAVYFVQSWTGIKQLTGPTCS